MVKVKPPANGNILANVKCLFSLLQFEVSAKEKITIEKLKVKNGIPKISGKKMFSRQAGCVWGFAPKTGCFKKMVNIIPSWELTYPLPKVRLKMIFPIPMVGYVSSLENISTINEFLLKSSRSGEKVLKTSSLPSQLYTN